MLMVELLLVISNSEYDVQWPMRGELLETYQAEKFNLDITINNWMKRKSSINESPPPPPFQICFLL